jgi:hypothetical protein
MGYTADAAVAFMGEALFQHDRKNIIDQNKRPPG